MRLAFFEDEHAFDFGPLTQLRPTFELVCGQMSLRQRLLRRFGPEQWAAFIRGYLAESYRAHHPEAAVNDVGWLTGGETLFINGRWLPPAGLQLDSFEPGCVYVVDKTIVAFRVSPEEAAPLVDFRWDEVVARLARHRTVAKTDGVVVRRGWQLVDYNAEQLRSDFHRPGNARGFHELDAHVALCGNPDDLYVAPSATLDPFVVLDTRSGPVYIDESAVVGSFSKLEGPCYIGPETQLFRAHVRPGTTIGPNCRAGGEIETSILHSHVNKYHTGFLGHSYVCPWVNLGALSTNSDLKNNYSNVGVPLDGELVDSGMTKVGCFIGDHAKTALGSLFNTGTHVGVMSMVLPGGRLLPREIPSFARVWHGQLDDRVDLQQALETARIVMARRGVDLTSADESLLRQLHQRTSSARNKILAGDQARRAEKSAVPILG